MKIRETNLDISWKRIKICSNWMKKFGKKTYRGWKITLKKMIKDRRQPQRIQTKRDWDNGWQASWHFTNQKREQWRMKIRWTSSGHSWKRMKGCSNRMNKFGKKIFLLWTIMSNIIIRNHRQQQRIQTKRDWDNGWQTSWHFTNQKREQWRMKIRGTNLDISWKRTKSYSKNT